MSAWEAPSKMNSGRDNGSDSDDYQRRILAAHAWEHRSDRDRAQWPQGALGNWQESDPPGRS